MARTGHLSKSLTYSASNGWNGLVTHRSLVLTVRRLCSKSRHTININNGPEGPSLTCLSCFLPSGYSGSVPVAWSRRTRLLPLQVYTTLARNSARCANALILPSKCYSITQNVPICSATTIISSTHLRHLTSGRSSVET